MEEKLSAIESKYDEIVSKKSVDLAELYELSKMLDEVIDLYNSNKTTPI